MTGSARIVAGGSYSSSVRDEPASGDTTPSSDTLSLSTRNTPSRSDSIDSGVAYVAVGNTECHHVPVGDNKVVGRSLSFGSATERSHRREPSPLAVPVVSN